MVKPQRIPGKSILYSVLACSLVLFTLAAPAQPVEKQTIIGIANFGPHPALEQSISGFKEHMRASGYIDGKNTHYVYSDANFTPALIPQTLSQIESQHPALILTITTPVSQAALAAVSDKSLPLVFLQVTDPVAAGLVPSWEHGGSRFTGSSSIFDYEAVLNFSRQAFPGARSFGLLYNPGEVNDVVALRHIQAAAQKLGLGVNAVSVDGPADVTQRMQLLAGVDFFYAIASSLVQSSMPAVAAMTDRYKIPILSAETELIKTGMVAVSYASPYASQGAAAARLGVQILEGKKPSELAPARPAKADYRPQFSRKKFLQLGKTIPPAFANCDCFVN